MSKKQNPEIPQKLLDSLIRTVVEQGFSPSIDVISKRAGVCKMSAYAQFTSRTGMTIAALERVGSQVRKKLEVAVREPGPGRLGGDIGYSEVFDSLIKQLTDRENPIGFITSCLLGHPDPRTKIHIAAMREHAEIEAWLEGMFRKMEVPEPDKSASSVMAVLHGTYANVLARGIDGWKSIMETEILLLTILVAARESGRTLQKQKRARRERLKGGG